MGWPELEACAIQEPAETRPAKAGTTNACCPGTREKQRKNPDWREFVVPLASGGINFFSITGPLRY